jgi:hypothetical protein
MITMTDPSVRNPTLALMGWTLPAAWGPNVAAILPAMIAVDPDITTLRRPAALFVYRRRWANADHDLRKRCRREQSKGKQ